MKNSKNLFILIFVLATIATILSIWKFFFYQPSSMPPPTPPTPTPQPEISIPEGRGEPNLYEKLKEETQTNFPLISFMPHQEENWTIDYVGPLHLEVRGKANSEEIRNEVAKWIKEKGVNPLTHKIDWKISP